MVDQANDVRRGAHIKSLVDKLQHDRDRLSHARRLLNQAVQAVLNADGVSVTRVQSVGDSLLCAIEHHISVVDEWMQLLRVNIGEAAVSFRSSTGQGVELQPLLHGDDDNV